MQIRSYRPEDLHALYALDVACFAPPFRFSRATMRRCAEDPAAIVRLACEEENGDLLGFVIVQMETTSSESVGYLATLDVAPQAQRKGIGRGLLQCVEREARSAGAQAMALHVFVQNRPAIAMYEALGYRRFRTLRNVYAPRIDAFLYRKALAETATDIGAPMLPGGATGSSEAL